MPLFDHASNFQIYGGIFNDIQGDPATIKRMNEILEDDERQNTLAWVSPIDVTAKHFDVSNTRQAGTGQWLLDSDIFQAWERGNQQALWFPGLPGAGKTVLASLVIDYLCAVQRRERVGSIGVAWAYYNYKEELTQTPNTIFLSLVRQLAGFSTDLYGHLKSAYRKDRNSSSSAQRLVPDMRILTGEFDKVFIVIDALDECAEANRDPLLKIMADLQAAGANILITSRDHIYDNITSSNLAKVQRIDIRASTHDITKYLNARLDEERRLAKIIGSSSLRQEIITAIVDSCQGMFLIATFHVEALRKRLNAGEILELLKVLPKTFPAIYDDAMNRIESSSDRPEVALRVLSVLTYARRQLTLPELQHFIAIKPDHTDFHDEFVTDKDTLISLCAGLVVFDNETEIIRLVHFTAQEYFDKIRMTKFPDGNIEMARVCLTYLSFSTFQGIIHDYHSWLSRYALLHYVVVYWHTHVHNHQEALKSLLCDYLTNTTLLVAHSRLKQIYDTKYFGRQHNTITQNYGHTGLHVAAANGFFLVAEWLLAENPNANLQDFSQRTPLMYSCLKGNAKMAEFLISRGATVDKRCGEYGTALQGASSEGHEAVVRSLLSTGKVGRPLGKAFKCFGLQIEGAAVSAQERMQYGSALYAASKHGHEAVVCLLLENGAAVNRESFGGFQGDTSPLVAASLAGHEPVVRLLLGSGAAVNASGGYYGTALQAASLVGHEAVVRLLLGNGAAVNTCQGGYFGTALQAASLVGHEAVVRLLLETGADINMQSSDHQTALQAASHNGKEAVVRLLLEAGADVNIQGSKHGTALQAASNSGHEAIVRLLLETGANVNIQGSKHGTALQAASYRGHGGVVCLLLESGAAINCKTLGGIYGNALQAASGEGKEDIVRLLLETGADVNIQGGDHQTALQAASYSGHEAVVRLLLETGANVNIQGGKHGTALQAASHSGHGRVVCLLLESGAAVNAQGGMDGSALQAASRGGYEYIVRLLLESGAAVNAQGGLHGSALQAALIWGNNGCIVRLLLEHGADVNTLGGVYGSAVCIASQRGNEAFVRLLLAKGADVNTKGGLYTTALHAASEGGHEAVVRLLLENGAAVNMRGSEGETALQLASQKGHETIVRLLLESGAVVGAGWMNRAKKRLKRLDVLSVMTTID